MAQLILVFAVSFGSLGLGYVLRVVLAGTDSDRNKRLQRFSAYLKLFTLLGVQPIAIITSFWQLSFRIGELVAMPVLGASALIVGGIAAVTLSRIQQLPPERAASVFVAGSFSNIGLFGGLIAFALYGSTGFSLLQLYRVFEEFLYYSVGFPLSGEIAKGNLKRLRLEPKNFLDRPIALIPLGGIVIGLALNASPLAPPDWAPTMMTFLVPILTGLMGFSIGLSLQIKKVGHHGREILSVVAVKYLIVPTVIITAGLLFGLGAIHGGLPLRVVAIAALMPTGFLALVPPVLYGFDLDATNSAWLVTTGAQFLIVPILVLVLGG